MGKDFNIDGDVGIGELSPGSTGRRWEPEEGVKKLNERIHKDSKFADDYKNHPFKFSKPAKSAVKNKVLRCDSCGHIIRGSRNTVSMICPSCKIYSSVQEVVYVE